jgi:DNA invertase Pin-like site-specific DNA recombinase
VAHLLTITEALKAKCANLRVLDLGIDTGTPTGKLMLTVLGGIAEFEREIMLERQREGIARARADGKYKGRKPTARAKAEAIRELKASGVGPSEIAKRLGIGRASVYRVLG